VPPEAILKGQREVGVDKAEIEPRPLRLGNRRPCLLFRHPTKLAHLHRPAKQFPVGGKRAAP